jgi:hypothetical protein
MDLSPAQQDVLDLLGAPKADRPTFDAALRHELRAELEHQITTAVDSLDPDGKDQLFVNKHALASIHGCEAKYLADGDEPFVWTPQLARGTVAHKAIELSVTWKGQISPLDLVEEAIARLENGTDGLADWLQTMSESDGAELRSVANQRVAAFLEIFPPLQRNWIPVPEAKMRAELADQRVIVQGRADLTLGRAHGTTAGKVVIDFKTGGFNAAHTDDLRLYALLDALRLGTPPRLLANAYLETGELRTEAVSEDLLWSAVHRTADGITRVLALRTGKAEPIRRPGPPCRWCSLADDCEPGRQYLSGEDA